MQSPKMLVAPPLSFRAAGRPGLVSIDVNVNVKKYSLKRPVQNQRLRREKRCLYASKCKDCPENRHLVC
jgi:hypothetical protein